MACASVPPRQKQSLLSNNSKGRDGNEFIAKGLSEGFESSGLTDSSLELVLSEDAVVVGSLGGDEMIDDAGELVCGGGDGLWGPEPVAHAAVGVTEARFATV